MESILASRLREARGELSVTEVSLRTGISEARIRQYESGARHPYGKTLRRLAQGYGIPIAELSPAAAPAPQEPQRVRRRRMRAQDTADGTHVIEIPVDLKDGESIRLSLELVLRPRTRTVAPAQEDDRADGRVQHTEAGSGLIAEIASPATIAAFQQAYNDFRRERK